MKIPNNYDRNAAEGFEALTPGGHKCVIMQAEEKKSQNGKQMLVVSFDTSEEDTQPKYFSNRYLADTRTDKKWQGNAYIVLEGEYAEANLNRLLGALDHSNENFNPAKGGELDPAELKGLKVGIVFRREEYINMGGEVRSSVKHFRWCAYDKALDQEAPQPKLLQSSADALQATRPQTAVVTPSAAGFIDVPAGADETEGLPFR